MDGWADFCVAQIGASAALAGLVFVGVSINLATITAKAPFVGIILEAMLALALVLGACSILITPHQPPALVGGEILAFSLALWLALCSVQRRIYLQTPTRCRRNYWQHVSPGQAAMLTFIAAGIWLLAGGTTGLILYLPGTLLCYAAALNYAWDLLIEINR